MRVQSAMKTLTGSPIVDEVPQLMDENSSLIVMVNSIESITIERALTRFPEVATD
jgi:hypothetical protein